MYSATVDRRTFVNVMGQYHPDHEVATKRRRDGRLRYASINRRIDTREVLDAKRLARSLGLRVDERG